MVSYFRPLAIVLAMVSLFPIVGLTRQVVRDEPVAVHAPTPPAPVLPAEIDKGDPGPKERLDKAAKLTAQATQYLIGEPTDEEQLYLEYINRARADAMAEAARLRASATDENSEDYNSQVASGAADVDFDIMDTQFESLPASAQPLAFNATLIDLARLHSQDQFTNVFQGHVSSSDPPAPLSAFDTFSDRLDAVGWISGVSSRENVFSSARSAWHGHAGFNIDWAGAGDPNAVGGMQDPPGHRLAIHGADSREIGVGVVLGNRTDAERPDGVSLANVTALNNVGPQVVTQVFGGSDSFDQFLTGVAFLDFNGDGFYNLGEGLGGVTIEVEGVDYYAVTSNSGGYAIPLPGQSGNFTVTISGTNITTFSETVNVPSVENHKMDYVPSFSMPQASGSATPATGSAASYSFTPLPGVPNYRIRLAALSAGAWLEGAEETPGQYTITQSEGYDVVQSVTAASGSNAFHLVTDVGIATEIVELERDIIPTEASQLRFQSKLGFATADQTARVDLSTDGGGSWTPVFEQAGNGGSTDSAFVQKTVDLSAYAGQVINLRLAFDYPGGNRFVGTTTDIGWLIDDITVTESSLVGESLEVDIPTESFDFTPPYDGDFSLQVAGLNGERVYPYGPPVFLASTGGGATTGDLAGSLTSEGGTLIVPAETAGEFLPLAVETDSAGWWIDPSLGPVHVLNYPWIFHPELGWMYVYGESNSAGYFVFIPGMGWHWTSNPGAWPYLYDIPGMHWLYFDIETSTPTLRWFYDFSAPGWMSPDNEV